MSALGIENRITPFFSVILATSTSSPCSFFKMYAGRLSPMSIGASTGAAEGSAGGGSAAYASIRKGQYIENSLTAAVAVAVVGVVAAAFAARRADRLGSDIR